MTRRPRKARLALAALALALCAADADDAVRSAFAALAARVGDPTRPVLRGRDGWLYFGPELRHLSLASFWGERAAAVSRARRPEWADPQAAILDFARQLDAAGVELLLVPVPAKAAIQPEGLPAPVPAAPRLDPADAAFYQVLREAGVQVLDLEPGLRAQARRAGPPPYCRQDTHWCPPGLESAAAEIAAWIRARPWWDDAGRERFDSEAREIELRGDLWTLLDDPALPRETRTIHGVGRRRDGRLEPLAPSRESPVLLLGDSHALVFHAGGDMHASGAGLPDHLARELGRPVDLIAVRGSGATPARVDLLRRGDALAGKRVVVWCLAAREFSEAPGGWRPLPVAR